MGRVQDLQYPDGALYRRVESWGEAWPIVRQLEADGYIKSRTGCHNTKGLRPGKLVVFRHCRNVWIFWLQGRKERAL